MLYDYPKYYEVAFSFRDIVRETEFLHRCICQFSGIPVKRILEIGCGPAPHAEQLVRHGYHYSGLDINANMIAHASDKWRDLNPSPEFIRGDMVSFRLPKKIDFAYVLLGSLYLNGTEDMHSHFDSIAVNLKKGGLYFLDGCVQFCDPLLHRDGNDYLIEKDGVKIHSEFDIRLIDRDRSLYEEIWTVNVDDRGEQREFKMVEHNRAIFPDKFMHFLSTRDDFEFVQWYKDWDMKLPVDDFNNVTRPVIIVKRV